MGGKGTQRRVNRKGTITVPESELTKKINSILAPKMGKNFNTSISEMILFKNDGSVLTMTHPEMNYNSHERATHIYPSSTKGKTKICVAHISTLMPQI